MSNRYQLSDDYWERLPDAHKALYDLVRPIANASYQVDIQWPYIEKYLASLDSDVRGEGGMFEENPDFQRGHVWTPEQQSSYIEACLRGVAPQIITLNSPNWMRGQASGDIAPYLVQCVDGLQRLTAIRKYLKGDVTVFGGLTVQDLEGSPFSKSRYRIKVSVFEFEYREELLQFYLDLNDGGTVHSQSELSRVRALRDGARESRGLTQLAQKES